MRIGSSLVAIGLGAAAIGYASKNNLLPNPKKGFNKVRRTVKSYL